MNYDNWKLESPYNNVKEEKERQRCHFCNDPIEDSYEIMGIENVCEECYEIIKEEYFH